MVLNKQGHILYNGLKDLVVRHLDELAEEHIFPAFPINPEQQSQEGEVLLKALRTVWDDHTSSMSKIGQILKYMVSLVTRMTSTSHIMVLRRTVFTSRLPMFQRRGILDSSFS